MDNNSLTYKNVDILSNFLNEQGKILPRRVTDLNSKQQKKITKLIREEYNKKPYVPQLTIEKCDPKPKKINKF